VFVFTFPNDLTIISRRTEVYTCLLDTGKVLLVGVKHFAFENISLKERFKDDDEKWKDCWH
jgi:hypothetical protein